MFDTLRNVRMQAAAASAGIVFIATVVGTGMSAADTPKGKLTEVSLQNTLKVTVEVTFSGDEGLKKIGAWQSSGDGSAHIVGKVPDGTTIKWTARPKHDQDKNQFTACTGEKKVSGTSTTIVITPDGCSKANAAPKPEASNNKTSAKSADSTDSSTPKNGGTNTQANNKTSGNKGDSAGSSAPKNDANKTQDNNKTSGSSSAGSAGNSNQNQV